MKITYIIPFAVILSANMVYSMKRSGDFLESLPFKKTHVYNLRYQQYNETSHRPHLNIRIKTAIKNQFESPKVLPSCSTYLIHDATYTFLIGIIEKLAKQSPQIEIDNVQATDQLMQDIKEWIDSMPDNPNR